MDSLYNGGYFVADVAHSFATNDWWYYIHLDNGMEQFSDIAVTDNFVVTVAPKINHKALYMRIFTKPQHVDLDLINNNRDPSIFDVTHRTPPYQSYCFMWADQHDILITPNPSVIAHPLVIHTNGDTFAVSYFTYAWNNQHEYGPVVKVLDIADMLHLAPSSSGGVPVIVDPPTPPGDPGTPAAPIGANEPGTNPVADPSSNTTDTIPFHYNRYIDLQNHTLCTSAINQLWSIKSMAYDSVKHCIVLLERNSYAPGFLDDNYAVDAFFIQSPNAYVERYNIPEPSWPLYSLSGGLNAGELCLSGNSNPEENEGLLLGMVSLNSNDCFKQDESIITHYHHGGIEDIINTINNSPEFGYRRFLPTASSDTYAAFTAINFNAVINSYEIDDICHDSN